MQDILDRKSSILFAEVEVVEEDDSKVEEGDLPVRENQNYIIAKAELDAFIQYKMRLYRPSIDKSKSAVLHGEDENGKKWEILVGPVLSRGRNLPTGKNIADYIDGKNHMFDTTHFFEDRCKLFPTLWMVVQCEAAMRNTEVGCERFFSLSGYILAPRRTRLGVRTYECMALLASNLPKIFLDKEWVAEEYLRRCKAGAWKKENTIEALKCWNLERVLDAELQRVSAPPPLTLDELVGEEGGASAPPSGSNAADCDVEVLDD